MRLSFQAAIAVPSAVPAAAGALGDVRGVRLAGGPSPAEGRLEVQLGDRWGLVRSNSWNGYMASYSPADVASLAAAATVCAQLGFGGGALRGAAFYGAGALQEVLAVPQCPPGAASLADCGLFRHEPAEVDVDYVTAVACHGEVLSILMHGHCMRF